MRLGSKFAKTSKLEMRFFAFTGTLTLEKTTVNAFAYHVSRVK